MIEQSKGTVGKVRLCCLHWLPKEPGGKSAIAARGLTWAGDPAVSQHPATTLEEKETPPEDNLREGRDGRLTVGEHIRFEGVSPMTGYVHLFNLGTSGKCIKLAPSEECPNNRIEAGRVLELPSEQFVRMSDFKNGVWFEEGPTTAEAGHPERILAIVTREDIELECEDLHPDLESHRLYTARGARGPGFGGPVQRNRARLFQLPPDSWEYGLISLEVTA